MATKPLRTKNKDGARRAKKKVSLLLTERVEYVDWKDVNLLRRFMSDRAKIRGASRPSRVNRTRIAQTRRRLTRVRQSATRLATPLPHITR